MCESHGWCGWVVWMRGVDGQMSAVRTFVFWWRMTALIFSAFLSISMLVEITILQNWVSSMSAEVCEDMNTTSVKCTVEMSTH